MNQKPYYLAYEDRYRAVYDAGIDYWGHSPENTVLYETLKKWVEDNRLQGKKVIEFACGEGACRGRLRYARRERGSEKRLNSAASGKGGRYRSFLI
jgi:hypothetical protein